MRPRRPRLQEEPGLPPGAPGRWWSTPVEDHEGGCGPRRAQVHRRLDTTPAAGFPGFPDAGLSRAGNKT